MFIASVATRLSMYCKALDYEGELYLMEKNTEELIPLNPCLSI